MKGRSLVRKSKNRGKRWIVALVAVAVVGIATAPFVWVKSDALAPGIYVNDIEAGGKTRAELLALLEERNQEMQAGVLTLSQTDMKEVWKYKDLHVRYSEASLDEAMALGRQGNLFQQWYDRWHMLFNGEASQVDAVYDMAAVQQKIQSLEQTYSKPPKNAYPTFHNDGSVTFSEGRPQLTIQEDSLIQKIDVALKSGTSASIEIPVSAVKAPNMSTEEAKEINRVIGRYTTSFYPEKNRSRNIELAAACLDGTYVKPGQTFSYNQTTGSRSAANGYLEAPVIINGKLEPGSGGGVCQVSTTLFNAVLLAGLEVTERTCHYSPVSYAPIGQDATVAEGALDFCFRNHLKHGVYIYTEYTPGQVTIWILGNQEDKPSSVTISKTKEETLPFKTITRVDLSQKEDCKTEEGHEGYNVTIAQDVKWADGRTYHDTFFSDYEPVDTVVTYNKEPSGGQRKENS